MASFYRILAISLAPTLALAACFPTDLTGETPDGSQIELMFYPGGSRLDDLVIYDGHNYFGKGQYQNNDPLGDIGFRLTSGERVQAECKTVGQDIMGDPECKRYIVYRSTWKVVPEGTEFGRPEMF